MSHKVSVTSEVVYDRGDMIGLIIQIKFPNSTLGLDVLGIDYSPTTTI
jgi:hypothetical protein